MKSEKAVRKFTSLMQKKLAILFFLVLLAFVCLSVRLISINRDNGDNYKKQVLSQQEYDSTTLPFKRGSIEDRNGTSLAYSEKVYNLIIDAKLMNGDDGEHLQPTLDALKKCFPQLDVDQVKQYVTDNPQSQYKKFLKRLTYDEVSPFEALETQTVSDPDTGETTAVAGVWFEEDYIRKYPYNSLACDMIGFVQGNNTGQYGLEEYYNDTLNGTDGREYGYLNDDSVLERTVKPAVDGKTIVTSLDTNIQSIVEKHIKEFNDEYTDNYRTGAAADNIGCIIMNPNTGEIYAMASYPVFDLNDPGDMGNIDLTDYTYLLSENGITIDDTAVSDNGVSGNSASADAVQDQILANGLTVSENDILKNAVWKNFCISDTYEPGSTMKPFTVAAAIDSGKITGNETYNCTGALEIGGHVIHCHNRLGDGLLTVQQGIAKSCNVVLMNVAFALGKDEWLRYNRNFNFGLKTNIDLAGEVNASQNTFDASMGQTDLAVASFGQGFNVTMIQMISGFSALINGGNYYQPHVVDKVLNSEGAVVTDVKPRILKQVVSSETSDKIREDCNSVVMGGDSTVCTGWSARPAGYTMGGKTGTAEKLPRSAKNYLVSFMGYVPTDNPQVICYVVIDHPNVESQDNARLATVLCRDIMTEVLPYLNIFPTLELTDKEKEELAAAEGDFATGSDAVSGNSVSDNTAVSSNATDAMQIVSGNSAEVSANKIKYDPDTGYPIDPNTGEVLDPDTLQPVGTDTKSDLDY